jgi:hypothetical protein
MRATVILGIGSRAAMQHPPKCSVGFGDLVNSDDLVNRGDLVAGDEVVGGNDLTVRKGVFSDPTEPSGSDLRDSQMEA